MSLRLDAILNTSQCSPFRIVLKFTIFSIRQTAHSKGQGWQLLSGPETDLYFFVDDRHNWAAVTTFMSFGYQPKAFPRTPYGTRHPLPQMKNSFVTCE
ncbi:hypothetical protein CEXT_73801 [Caerostris extrusa]|uniref:Uncharacterized protein n=1 Tax=Caerostris extrusa TaxID=172846 RepID=A0AAV4QGB5_CAEEX|nr:hypothetical protein CEXT_73801 [Caerostris extrusa]